MIFFTNLFDITIVFVIVQVIEVLALGINFVTIFIAIAIIIYGFFTN